MDLNKAASILEIDLNAIKLSSLTQDYIKKQFHKLALINHPDKNGNSVESTNKFQQINEAYEYLSKELNDLSFAQGSNAFVSSNKESNETNESNSKYIYLLSLFIGSIVNGQYKEAIKNVIKEIVTYGLKQCEKNIYLERIFLELDKDSALEVFNFICKYKHILHISNETLEFVSSLIKKKYNNDRVFILNPSITDLMENNIFKLYVDDQLYLVPLWHDELYFDGPTSDIIVLCNPELPANMVLDEDNNLHVQIDIEGNKLLDLIKKDSSCSFVSLLIGNRDFSIPLNKLYMKKEQIYKFVKQGISRVIEDDIYNISCKTDIIVKIRIV
jgi:hypothetical protein